MRGAYGTRGGAPRAGCSAARAATPQAQRTTHKRSFGTQTFVENFAISDTASGESPSSKYACALGCTCSALRPTVVHPCSCALNYHSTCVARLPSACGVQYTTLRRRRAHEGKARSTLRSESHEAAQTATWSARAHCAIWPVLPSAQRRPKGGKNESGRLPGFQCRLSSASRCVLYTAGSCRLSRCTAVRCLVVAVGRGGSSLTQ